MTDMRLAEKVLARGLNLSEGEPGWEAYHLAKDVLELREALKAIWLNAESWHAGEDGKARALAVIAQWASDPSSIPESLLLSQQEAGRDEDFDRDEEERERIERTFAP